MTNAIQLLASVAEKVLGAVRFAQGVMAVLRAGRALRDQKAKLSLEVLTAQTVGGATPSLISAPALEPQNRVFVVIQCVGG